MEILSNTVDGVQLPTSMYNNHKGALQVLLQRAYPHSVVNDFLDYKTTAFEKSEKKFVTKLTVTLPLLAGSDDSVMETERKWTFVGDENAHKRPSEHSAAEKALADIELCGLLEAQRQAIWRADLSAAALLLNETCMQEDEINLNSTISREPELIPVDHDVDSLEKLVSSLTLVVNHKGALQTLLQRAFPHAQTAEYLTYKTESESDKKSFRSTLYVCVPKTDRNAGVGDGITSRYQCSGKKSKKEAEQAVAELAIHDTVLVAYFENIRSFVAQSEALGLHDGVSVSSVDSVLLASNYKGQLQTRIQRAYPRCAPSDFVAYRTTVSTNDENGAATRSYFCTLTLSIPNTGFDACMEASRQWSFDSQGQPTKKAAEQTAAQTALGDRELCDILEILRAAEQAKTAMRAEQAVHEAAFGPGPSSSPVSSAARLPQLSAPKLHLSKIQKYPDRVPEPVVPVPDADAVVFPIFAGYLQKKRTFPSENSERTMKKGVLSANVWQPMAHLDV